MRVVERVILPADPQIAWPVLTDWERQVTWMPDVASIRILGPERGLGARIEAVTKVFGLPVVKDVLEVTHWDPPWRLAVRHGGLVKGTGEWILDPVTGAARFTWAERLHLPPPLLGDLGLLLYAPVIHATFRRSMRNLARILEAS